MTRDLFQLKLQSCAVTENLFGSLPYEVNIFLSLAVVVESTEEWSLLLPKIQALSENPILSLKQLKSDLRKKSNRFSSDK